MTTGFCAGKSKRMVSMDWGDLRRRGRIDPRPLPISINSQVQPRLSKRGDPVVCEREIVRSSQLPGITCSRCGFDVEPESIDNDLVVGDISG